MPSPLSRNSRILIITLLALVSLALLGGSLRAVTPGTAGISSRHAGTQVTPTPQPSPTAPQAEAEAVPGDTTGMAIMAGLLGAIILFGTFWGSRVARPSVNRKPPKQ